MIPVNPCPWLGVEQDRDIRLAEPDETHLCYGQKPPADIELDYQRRYCLTDRHSTCPHYREPPAPAPPVQPGNVQDEVGPPPARFSIWQVLLWAAVAVAALAAIYYYGSTLLTPVATATPLPGEPGRPATPTPTVTPSPLPVAPLPTQAPLPSDNPEIRPRGTPTPYPGGRVYTLTPQPGAAGWVASDRQQGNRFGDSFLYAGVFEGVIYHGAVQFDLSRLPRGAPLYYAAIELTGLDASRLGQEGVWEVRILAREADQDWSRSSYQDIHNAPVQWSLTPALAARDLRVGVGYTFELTPEQLRDLEQRLLDEHYTLSIRIDGPLAGADSVFAWDTGSGPASRGHPPRLIVSAGPPPQTPVPTIPPPPTTTPTPSLTPTPTDTPEWFIVTSTPTPENAMTAAAIALQATAWATSTGTPTPLPQYVATATPRYRVVTRTPTPANYATAVYRRSLATANVLLTGTPTPTPPNLATATFTPRPTSTPVYIWLDELVGTPTPTLSPTPTPPPIPASLRGKILFLSDRSGKTAVYMLDPASGRVAVLTAPWPYDLARRQESLSPDGQSWAYVKNDGRNVPQVYIHSEYYGGDWQVTFTTDMSYDPVWSPLGDTLAFVSTEGGNDDIYTIGTDGKNQKRMTFNQWEWDKHPSFSPDGSQIVFWSNRLTGHKQLWIMNADGSGQRLLLESPYNDWDPVWVK